MDKNKNGWTRKTVVLREHTLGAYKDFKAKIGKTDEEIWFKLFTSDKNVTEQIILEREVPVNVFNVLLGRSKL